MFCPKCLHEYREGFTECSDCKISLVKELPLREKEKNDFSLMELIRSDNRAEISYLQSIFEAEDIPFHIAGGHMIGAGPLYGGGLAIIYVSENKYSQALEIINNLNWTEE